MIEIRNMRGEVADLYPDTSFTIERYNPLFNEDDKLFEDIVYGTKFPANDFNKVFLDHGHLIEADNGCYEVPVQTLIFGVPFSAGSIRYKLVDNEFDVLLKVNFGAIYQKVKSVKMCEIYMDDAPVELITAAQMKLVCQNPENYPYSFFPVYNEKWNGAAAAMTNPWNHTSQGFLTSDPITPFYKLKYVLIKTMAYLGFQCAGSFIDDRYMDNIYIFNTITRGVVPFNSNVFLPSEMTIEDFLKDIKNRFLVSCSFDVFNGLVRIESGNSMIETSEVFDVSPYISKIIELAAPEQNGYVVTLKPDSRDALFKDPGDASKFMPTNKLVIGDGEKEIEINASTLKSKTVDDYSMPNISTPLFGKDNFQIKFLFYNGMKPVAGGKVFPEAKPVELNENDARWWQMLNDGKPVRLIINLPTYMLPELSVSKKIGITSEQGFYQTAIIEKTSCNVTNNEIEFIEVEIDCRTIVFDLKTQVLNVPFPKTEAESAIYNNNLIKAYFQHTGMPEVEVRVFYPIGTNGFEPGLPLTSPRIDKVYIKKSTDRLRGGGSSVYMPYFNIDTVSRKRQEIRVYSGVPKYLVVWGVKIDFQLYTDSTETYYWCKPYEAHGMNAAYTDYQPLWIVY